MSKIKLNQSNMALINAAVDDELDAAQKSELEVLLSESSDAQEAYQRLKDLSLAIDALPVVQVPTSLKQDLLTIITANTDRKATDAKDKAKIRPHARHGKNQAKPSLSDWFGSKLKNYWQAGGVAIAVAATLAVGIQQINLPNLEHGADGAMLGTLMPESKLGLSKELDKIAIDSTLLSGELNVFSNNNGLQLQLSISDTTAEGIQLKVLDGYVLQRKATPGQFARAQLINPNEAQISASQNSQFRFGLGVKDTQTTDSLAAIRVEISDGNSLIFKGKLNTVKK